MKRRRSNQEAQTDSKRFPPRKTTTKIIAIVALCLSFAQAAMAATGTVNYNTVYQQIEGFGGAIVYDAPDLDGYSNKNTVYDLLFSDLGIEFVRIRNCVGYDSSAVTATGHIIAAANARRPVKLELVPWSPPANLKSGGSTTGGTLAKSGGVYVYASYADWWADSLNTWASNGVYPDYISIQNEPDIVTSYDSCKFLPTEDSSWAGYNQAFEAVYDELYSRMGDDMPKMLAPETMGITGGDVGGAAPYINALIDVNHAYGFSHHLYSDGTGSYSAPDDKINAMTTFNTNYGYKPLFQTEYSRNPTFEDAIYTAWHIHNCMTYEHANAYFYWSLMRSGSTSSGGVVTLIESGGTPTSHIIRPTYYALKHYSYFTDANWYVVQSSTDSSNLRITAFKNPDGDQLTVVILNKSSTAESLTLTLNDFSPDDSEVYRSSSTENWVSLGEFSNPISLPAQSYTTIALYITGPQQTLSISSTTGGSVTTPGEGDFQYAQGTNATIVATPDLYYHFVNWTGTAVDADKVADPDSNSTTVTMDADYTVVANFEANPPDTTPPSPNPMTWASPPSATGSTSITMTAATATDTSGVEYYFDCLTAGGHDRSWQDGTTYQDTGLNPSTQYTYQVKAHDKSPAQNETDWSTEESATTEAPPTDVEILGSWATGTTHTKESGTNRALVFIAHAERNGAVSLNSVTYGGQSMTKVIERVVSSGSPVYYAYVAAYILNEAGVAAATSNTFVPTWSAAPDTGNAAYASVFLQNVNQTTPVGATDSNGTTSSTPNTIKTNPLTTSDGDMVIEAATCGNTGDYTVYDGFTEAIEHDMTSSTGTDGYKSATGASETPRVSHNNVNRQVLIGFVVKAAAAINYPPAAPTGLSATAGNQTVSLDWNNNSEPDLAGYNVYRSTTQGSGYGKINSSLVVDSNYIDNDVNNGTPYYYVVTAVDDANNESGYSNEDLATPVYQNCSDVQAGGHRLNSDLNGNCYIDYEDFATIAEYWLNTDCGDYNNCEGADFEPTDGVVDFFDFSDFAIQWMQCNDPQDSDCTQNW